MSTLLSQDDFAKYAAKWSTFIAKAKPEKLRKLFQKDDGQAQLFISFDLPTVIIPLLSTVGIAMVRTRFVRLPAGHDAPRFGVAVYAADSQGGRISAYYLGTSQWQDTAPQLKSCAIMPKLSAGHPRDEIHTELNQLTGTGNENSSGIVPFNLAKGWICDWCWAVSEQRLDPAMFTTSYGWLLGYDFQLDDFLDPLFQMSNPQLSTVRAVFGLKRYYPAYPENLDRPAYTFELVIRPYSPAFDSGDLSAKLPTAQRPSGLHSPEHEPVRRPADGGADGGAGGGDPSMDQSMTNPPGI
ncbi:MAG: hypothetical protein EOO59_03290 [Hymenobacter sp.]|nr:MAG: hypothetical protein EOO59_03290 [Hymenobacter sp.]